MASSVDKTPAVASTAVKAAPAKAPSPQAQRPAATSAAKFKPSITKAQAGSVAAPKPAQTTAGKPLPPSRPLDANTASNMVRQARDLNTDASRLLQPVNGDGSGDPDTSLAAQSASERQYARGIAESVTANQSGANQLLPADADIHNTQGRADLSKSPEAFGLGQGAGNPLTTADRASFLANEGDMSTPAGDELQSAVSAQLDGLNRGAVNDAGAPIVPTHDQAVDRAHQYASEAQGRIDPAIVDPAKRQQFDQRLQKGVDDYVASLPKN